MQTDWTLESLTAMDGKTRTRSHLLATNTTTKCTLRNNAERASEHAADADATPCNSPEH